MSGQKTPLFQPLKPPQLKSPGVNQHVKPRPASVGDLHVEDDAEAGTDPYNTAAHLVAEHYRKT